MSNDDYILKHYSKVAKNFGLSSSSTIQDPVIRKMEVDFFLNEIKRTMLDLGKEDLNIFDLGCGNGFLLNELHQAFPYAQFKGLEFTPELYELAKNRNLERAQIILGDCRKPEFFQFQADLVISERVIINLLSWKFQAVSFDHIHQVLKQGGTYLMSESFTYPWQQFNKARDEVKLPQIAQSKHNRYLTYGCFDYLEKKGFTKETTILPSNALSSHFYIGRIFHPLIRPDGGRGKFSQFSQFFDSSLKEPVGHYSPIEFHRFKKR